MASIHQEIVIGAAPERVWDAVRDVGAIHERLERFAIEARARGQIFHPKTDVVVHDLPP